MAFLISCDLSNASSNGALGHREGASRLDLQGGLINSLLILSFYARLFLAGFLGAISTILDDALALIDWALE